MTPLGGSKRWRLAVGALGLAGAVFFAAKGDWAATVWLALVAIWLGGQGLAESLLWGDGKTPYDEYRLEGFGFAFLALVFFLLGIAWLVGLIDDPERFVYGGISIGASACFLFVVVRVFKFGGPID
jgi:hypothetical protein